MHSCKSKLKTHEKNKQQNIEKKKPNKKIM